MKPKYYIASYGNPKYVNIYFKVEGNKYWFLNTSMPNNHWIKSTNTFDDCQKNFKRNFGSFKEITYEDLVLELL